MLALSRGRVSTRFSLVSYVLLLGLGAACGSKDGSDHEAMGGSPSTGGSAGESGKVELCEFGEDAGKCGGNEQLSCFPGLVETGTTCTSDSQCGNGELCFREREGDEAGWCFEIAGQCVPRCGGDFDCGSGYCDPESGECVEQEPTGRAFGESCTQDGQCRGSCVSFFDGTSECEELCRVGAESGCGFETIEGSGVACAYFAYDLSDIEVEQGAGDTGICAALCDCDAECPGQQLCYPIPTEGRHGICTGGLEENEGITCGGGGAAH